MIQRFKYWLVTLIAVMNGCTANPSQMSTELAPYEEDDIQRVNAPYALGYTQISLPSAGNTEYPDAALEQFQQGKLEPGEEVYANYWELYQYFLGGDVQKPESTVCLHHNIHFYLSSKKNEPIKRQRPQPSLIDVSSLTDDEFLSAQSKSCGDPKSVKHVISFRLFNYHFPTYSRNLLVLARAGFFDNRPFFFWSNQSHLPAIGWANLDWEPFVYPPEPKYDRQRSPTFAGDFIAAIINNPAGIPSTRQIVPFRVAFVDRESVEIDPLKPENENSFLPIPFGQHYAPFPNSIKDLAQLKSMAKDLQVTCVAIDEPVVVGFDVRGNSCPLTSAIAENAR